MTSTGHITAVLLVAALAATGCSERDETSRANEDSTSTAAVKPVSTSGRPTTATAVGARGTTVAAVTGPATFGDGKAAYDARKYSDATVIFEGYTARHGENAWGHYMLGLSAWKSGDLAKAESAFEQAVRIDPHHLKSYLNLSRVFIEQNRYDEAVARLTRAADVDPSSIEVRRLLGNVYRSQGNTAKAMEAYRQAIELDELDAWSTNNLGLVLLETEHAEEALPLFEKAVEIRKSEPAFHNNLGMALEHTGRVRDAAAAYANALAADPGYTKAKQNLARVAAIKGS